MKIVHLVLFVMFCTFFNHSTVAQQRRALLIGINNYYFKKNIVDPQNSLKGCVNDAKAVKGVITTRFGFKEQQVTELYDSEATKKNIVNSINKLLNESQRGDVAFIYYSGHGMELMNSGSHKDITRTGVDSYVGHNQCILATDVYEDYSSIIRDHELSALFNKFIDKGAILTCIFDCCYGGSLAMYENAWEINKEDDSKAITYYEFKWTYEDLNGKSIPYTDDDLNDTTRIVRPIDKPNSKFLFIGGATGVQKSYERRDESDIKHGLFTYALVTSLKNSPSNINVQDLFTKVQNEFKLQHIDEGKQSPVVVADKARLKNNLFAVSSGLSDKTVVQCLQIKGNYLYLNKGRSAGLAKGNILQSEGKYKASIEITDVPDDSTSTAILKSGSLASIAKGDKFRVVDWHITSNPILKIFIPQTAFSLEEFWNVFTTGIKPIRRNAFYQEYDKMNSPCYKYYVGKSNKFYRDVFYKKEVPLPKGNSFFIYLPIPAELVTGLKQLVAKDQNIILTANPDSAEASLYVAYSPQSRRFIFTIGSETIDPLFATIHQPSAYFVAIKEENLIKYSMQKLAKELFQTVILKNASNKRILNMYEKR